MKVSFDKSSLLSVLAPLSGISQTKNTVQSAEGLLFECPPNDKFGVYEGEDKNSKCRISAFDLEKGIQTTVDCTIYEEGLYILNTAKILQIVRVLPDGEVTITIDSKNRVTVKGGESSFEITANDGSVFPSLPSFSGETSLSLPQHVLKHAIEHTVFAVAVNDQRPAFNGLYMKISSGELTMVGCDGSRLALTKNAVPVMDTSLSASVVVPGKFMSELSKLLRDSEDEATVILARKHIICKIDDIYFFTRMIEAEYMNYERILPSEYKTEITVTRNGILSAFERAAVVTEDKIGGNNKSYVRIDVSDSSMNLSSVSEGGSIREKIISAKTGADIAIGFNCRLVYDVLKNSPSDCEIFRIRMQTPTSGIVIEPVGGSGILNAHPDISVYGSSAPESVDEAGESTFLYFVMPIRMK